VLTTLATGERRLFEAPGPMPTEIASCLHSGESRLLDLADGQAFLHALTPPVRLVIVGATHVGQVLADLATRIGYDVAIVDPRHLRARSASARSWRSPIGLKYH
jgi:xanthine dehydrogenase accessory factor